MDNITHTFTGLMLARCGLNRGAKGTALMMMMAANAPDMDVISAAGGILSYLEHHREFTHSFAFVPLVALVPWAIVRFIGRQPLGWWEYFAAILGVLSHLMLDFTNIYGIRLLLPFTGRWVRLDITDVVDPWILLLFLVALAVPALVKLVSDEIGGRKAPAPKRAWAWIAIVLLLGYEGVRYSSHERALGILNSYDYQGEPPVHTTAIPDRLNPFRWRGIIEGEGFVYEITVDVTGDFNPKFGHIDYPAQSSRYMDIARGTRAFQVFGSFNQVPFWRLSPLADGMRVELFDLRFGTTKEPGFTAMADIEANGHVRRSEFDFGPVR